MTPEIQTIIEEQGWSDRSVLALLWEYVDNQNDDAAVLDHFHRAQNLENHEASGSPGRSISDDDLCSACDYCAYNPGSLSFCSEGWPGEVDEDGYINFCAFF